MQKELSIKISIDSDMQGIKTMQGGISSLAKYIGLTRETANRLSEALKRVGRQGVSLYMATKAFDILRDGIAKKTDIALGIINDVTIQYAKNFSIIDITKEFSTLQAFKDLGYSAPTYERLKLLQIINNDLNSIDIEDMDNIKSELEDFGKE